MRTRTKNTTQALVRGSVALLLACAVPLLQGCDSAAGGGTQTNGGTTGAAGVTGAAGHANGGSLPTGGTPQVGGTTAASIPPSTGGTPQVGGTTVATIPTNTGGSTTIAGGDTGPVGDTGGSTVVTGGKTTVTGGKTGPTGGNTTVTGGKTGSTGGISIQGGVSSSGGVTSPTGGNTTIPSGTGHYQMENLDRGTVAVVVTGGVYVGWRMLGYEYDTTASNVSYNLYRDGTLVKNVTDSTNFLDAAGKATSKYTVSAVIKGTEGEQSDPVTPWAQQYTSIPLTPPGGSYSANDGSVGDLDGDGKLDIVLKWDPSNSHDNAQAGVTDDVYIDGYTLAGTKLFRINLGPNIRAGGHYTQMSVGDFDGDGKAELAVKTAPGTKDGTGAYLSTGSAAGADNSAVYRNASGYILTGPEWITVFRGTDGKELATVDYPVPRGDVGAWGDTYGNRVDRFNGGMAFVKDKAGVATGKPAIIQGRGYYTRLTVSSLTFQNGVLAQNWVYDSVTACPNGGGDHSEMAADTDGDGGQEIITGTRTIDSGGTLKCDAQMGHGDAKIGRAHV